MNPQQILFYTDAAEISPADLTRLRKTGIVPIKVADPSAARFVSTTTPLPIAPNKLFVAALEAIVETGYGHSNFVKKFTKGIITLTERVFVPSAPKHATVCASSRTPNASCGESGDVGLRGRARYHGLAALRSVS